MPALRSRLEVGGGQRLIEVRNDVLDVLDADREPDIAFGDAGAALIVWHELAGG